MNKIKQALNYPIRKEKKNWRHLSSFTCGIDKDAMRRHQFFNSPPLICEKGISETFEIDGGSQKADIRLYLSLLYSKADFECIKSLKQLEMLMKNAKASRRISEDL